MASSSPLTDLSTVSSPASFRTAFQSPDDADATGFSILSPPPVYSRTSQLPRELKAHCQIYLEEHLYNGALGLLNSLLTSGFSRQNDAVAAKRSVYAPPLTHLALLNTLVIHPSHTTRAAGPDRMEVGSLTLHYLRNLLAIVGPINAGFKGAFQFHGPHYNRRHRHHDEEEEEDDFDGEQISNKMAGEDSIWRRAQDFWVVVGWAFNCSRAHPHRWRFWKTWLEFMLDVLEADLRERKRMDEEASTPSQSSPWANLQESIIVMYVKQKADSNRFGLKMILQAVFADGSNQSLAKFPEIFNKETKGISSGDKKRKRMPTLDIENDQFGDYFNDELDSEPSDEGTPGTPRSLRTSARQPGEAVAAALADSIPLRLRLMELLSDVSAHLPGDFMTHREYTSELCRLLKQQNLAFFQRFVSEIGAHLSPAFKLDFMTMQLDMLLPSTYVDPGAVVPAGTTAILVNADVLRLCYLPNPANTIDPDDNARVALILENLLHDLSADELRDSRDGLLKAARKGVEARQAKARGSGRRGGADSTAASGRRGRGKRDPGAKELYEKEVMDLAGKRILLYIDVMGAAPEHDDLEMTD